MTPLVFVGVDIAYRRDTAAVAAVYRHRESTKFALFDHRIWHPPVYIPDVTKSLLRLVERVPVGGIYFDPFQFMSESQRLSDAGLGHLLFEVNQSSHMVEVGNNLHGVLQRGDFLMHDDDKEVRSQFSWCAAKETERGYRIVKQQQSKPIDVVVAIAMGLWGASQDTSHIGHPSTDEDEHSVALEDLP